MPLKCFGSVTRTVAGFSGLAVGWPMKSLMERAMRLAVVRSGLRNASRKERCAPSLKSISRSISPPEEMRPVVGTPDITVAPSPEALKPLMTTDPCAIA